MDGKKADFGVNRWPKEKSGQFFDGDSFIILHTYMKADKKLFDLFFWIGKDSSQDEYGVAAYKTVELADLLGGKAVQVSISQTNHLAPFPHS